MHIHRELSIRPNEIWCIIFTGLLLRYNLQNQFCLFRPIALYPFLIRDGPNPVWTATCPLPIVHYIFQHRSTLQLNFGDFLFCCFLFSDAHQITWFSLRNLVHVRNILALKAQEQGQRLCLDDMPKVVIFSVSLPNSDLSHHHRCLWLTDCECWLAAGLLLQPLRNANSID